MRRYQTTYPGIGATPCRIKPVTPGEDGSRDLPWKRRIPEFSTLVSQRKYKLSKSLRIGSGSGGGNRTPSNIFVWSLSEEYGDH